MKLYVGNLSYSATENELRDMFSQYGAVESVAVITDRDTGRSKGFGFVEFANDAEANAAIAGLNGKEVSGRALTVSQARPRAEGGAGGGRGGGGGGYGGGGGGRRNRY
jgi:cold-inducible RNA-binding protein